MREEASGQQGKVAAIGREDARHVTVEEWREMERRSHDAKHEYIDGQGYAMAGGSLAHGRIAGHALRASEDTLAQEGTPCNVYNFAVAARLSSRRYTCLDVWRVGELRRARPGHARHDGG